MPENEQESSEPEFNGDQSSSETADHESVAFAGGNCPVVGIGASAGGLEAITQLLKYLPASTGMAFVFVQHLDPHHESGLPLILAKHTAMPVIQVADGTSVEPDHFYVIPPNTQMGIRGGRLSLTPRPEDRSSHLPIDYFFRSLAQDQCQRAIGVILSGGGSDGTIGLEAIKAEGGITFAQDASARFESMPRQASATGVVDFVLPPSSMAEELVAIARHIKERTSNNKESAPEGPVLQHILQLLRERSGVDFTHYKINTIERRLARRMALHRVGELGEYMNVLEQNPGEVQALFDDVLITVTEFFRDPVAFQALAEKAFPRILKDRNPDDTIRIWVAGCSTGKEVYSLAIVLIEYLERAGRSARIQLFGTDVSERAIEAARLGKYPESIATTVSQDRLNRFFLRQESGYQIARSIRELCVFSRQDITKDPPLARMDLISCRNLLIYLGPLLQRRVMAIFSYALKPQGCLLLGSSETVGALAENFTILDAKNKLYLRNPTVSSPGFELPRSVTTRYRQMPAGSAARADDATTLERITDRLLLDEYAPSGFIVNSEFNVVKFRGDVGPYLATAPSEHTLNAFSVVREEFSSVLRGALNEAVSTDLMVRRRNVIVHRNGGRQEVTLVVHPINEMGLERFYLVAFEPTRIRREAASNGEPSSGSALELNNDQSNGDRAIDELDRELASTRSYLQRLIEELRSANEEGQSSNEELQSTNEELQTAKEELQSSNEELQTTNEEMQSRNAELAELNDDLVNLLSSLRIPIIMLNSELRIRRYTPVAATVFNLIPTDVGRPISDLRQRIDAPNLTELLEKVIRSGEPIEQEVQGSDQHWYSMRIQPYRTVGNRIDGAVLQLLDIDPLKRTIQQAETARDYANAILATVRVSLLVLDKNLRVETANQSFYSTFGAAPDQTLQRSIFDLADGRWDLPAVRTFLEGVRGGGDDARDLEFEHHFPKLGLRTFQLFARRIGPVSEAGPILLAIEDTSERKRMAEVKYRRLFEAAKDGMLILEAATGLVSDINPYAVGLLGLGRDQALGRHFWEVVPIKDRETGEKVLANLKQTEMMRLPEMEITTARGNKAVVEIVGNAYLEGDRRVIQFNIRDITERRRFEQKLQQTAKLESLGVLAGGIAHDFNNLLTGIMGNASLALVNAPPQAEYRTALREVIEASHRAADLTRQMLAYAGKGRFVIKPVDIGSMVREISALVRASVPKSVQLQLDLEERLPLVEADPVQMQQLIMNLVINAAEATEQRGFGRVRVGTRTEQLDPVSVSFAVAGDQMRAGTYVVLEVSDNGAGMEPSVIARMFDPFFTTKFTGRGLGLAAAQGIMRTHQAGLRVRSTPGEGSTFEAYLPALATAESVAGVHPGLKDLRGTGLILVVDDERAVTRLTQTALEASGYRALIAENGELALHLMKERGAEIDLVLLDLTMPVLSGEETFRRIRAMGFETPVILSSGYESSRVIASEQFPGLSGFLQKPFTADALLSVVKQVLTSGTGSDSGHS